MDLAPGSVLLGKYRIDELIGSGGMGNVVRASHLYLQQAVAIKILLPQLTENAETVQRFLREAQSTVKLKSEHSARVMDVGTTPEGTPFMVMEFLEGSDLHQILRHHGRQPPTVVVDLMLQACEGLAEAHGLGIIHRDVKPSNFFITRRPDGSPLLKILDFGISKASVGYDELTGTQTVIGTPTYMAPEQMKSGRSADPRSDIWSIGVVMYQMLTGRPPFAGETYADLVLKVGLEPPEPIQVALPPGLPEAVLRCLEKDPGSRYPNIGELARVIAPYATDPMSGAQAASRVARILAQRGAPTGAPPLHAGHPGHPGSVGAGTPIPLSPAQLTPGGWSPSQVTSLSQGAGQVGMRSGASKGWLIGGIISLCTLAGVGGYAISQMSKPDEPSRPHVLAPEPTNPPAAASVGSEAPDARDRPAAQAGSETPDRPAAAPAGKQDDALIEIDPPAPAQVDARPVDTRPADARPAGANPADARPGDAKPAGAKPVDTRPADARPAGARPADARPAGANPADARPADARPAGARPDARPADTRPAGARPDARPADTKPADAKPPASAKPADGKSPGRSRPKKPDDLFDSRK